MPERKFLPAPHRTPCAGDLRMELRLLDRKIVAPKAGKTDATVQFSEVARPWGDVRTPRGKTFYDGVNNVELAVTHQIYIRFRSDVDVTSWLELRGGSRVRVLEVQNLDERDEWLFLTCTERGPDNVQAARA